MITRIHTKRYALLLLAVVGLWQMGSLTHLLTVRHEVCCHGKVVDGASHADHTHVSVDDAGESSGDNSPSPRHSGHGNCRTLELLTGGGALPGPGPAIASVRLVAPEIPAVPATIHTVCGRNLYLTAPSHSPPRA